MLLERVLPSSVEVFHWTRNICAEDLMIVILQQVRLIILKQYNEKLNFEKIQVAEK